MSSLTFRGRVGEVPVLVIDGEDLPADATVTMRAADIAQFAYVAAPSGAAAGVRATAGVANPPRRRVVERDADGRIVALVDE